MSELKRRSKEEHSERKRLAIQWYGEGISVTEIGRRLGITQSSVSHMLRKLGVAPSWEKRESRTAALTPELKSRLIELANQGWTAKTISDELEIDYDIVRNTLRQSGVDLEPFGRRKGRHGGAKVGIEPVMSLYRKGLSIPAIAKQLQISRDVARRRLKWGGVIFESVDEAEILAALKQGHTARQCAEKLGISETTIRRYAKLAAIDFKQQTLRSQVTDQILHLRRQGMSCYEIAEKVGMDHTYVWRILKELAPDLLKAVDRGKFLVGKAGRKCLVDVEKAKTMLADGMSLQKIADYFGCSSSTVQRQFRLSKVILPKNSSASRSKQIFDTIVHEGLSVVDAADRFMCSPGNIRNVVRKYDYAFRDGKLVSRADLEARRAERELQIQHELIVTAKTSQPEEELPDSPEWLRHIQNMKYFLGSDSDYCRRNGLKVEIFRAYKKKHGIRLRKVRRTPQARGRRA